MAFIAPILTAFGASAATVSTVGTVASVASAAMTVLGGISQANASKDAARYNADAADYNTKVSQYNAKNAANAAATNRNLAYAKANEQEAISQIAAKQKRKDLELKLSRAYAVAAAQGGGAPQENIVGGILDRGETAAQYDLYSGRTTANNLRFQGDTGYEDAVSQGAAGVRTAQIAQSQADYKLAGAKSAYLPTVLGSVVKGASMLDLAPGPAPGVSAIPSYGYGELGSGTYQSASSPLDLGSGLYTQSSFNSPLY